MAITTHALDLVLLHHLLWGFEEREKIMNFMKEFLGARLHSASY
jgi:NADH:ubiquinone oxidoreductase subunit D